MGKEQFPKRGLVIDGVIASAAVDSAGEVLDVEGADISSMEVDGVLNVEHANAEEKGFDTVIGKCIRCKKIFGADDCENDRERMYWEKTKLPFIYGAFRLFDESDHDGARAAAAIIRDQDAAGEPLLLRFSVEGSTLERDGNVLKRTIARRCALTAKPCNRSAVTGLLHDPKAKSGGLGELTEKHESPERHVIGSAESIYVPFDADPASLLVESLDRARALTKTATAGMPTGMPGSQVGGDALQAAEEDDRFKYACKAAVRDYDPVRHGEFRQYLKNELPDACDSFLDRFADLVGDWTVKKKLNWLSKADDDTSFDFGHNVAPAEPSASPDAPPKAKVKAKKLTWSPKMGPDGQQVVEVDRYGDKHPVFTWDHNGKQVPKATIIRDRMEREHARAVKGIKTQQKAGDLNAPQLAPADSGFVVRRKGKHGVFDFDEERGAFITPKAQYKVFIPSPTDTAYFDALKDPHINEVHDRAMDNWYALHKLARDGKLPDEVFAHTFLHSAMSPNTSVSLQELAHGFLQDMMARGWDPTKRLEGKERSQWDAEFQSLLAGRGLPQYMNDHFARRDSGIWTKDGPRQVVGLGEQKARGALAYADLHDAMTELYRQHGADGAAISARLNGMKHEAEKWKSRDYTARKQGKDIEPFTEPSMVDQFAPKTIRYALGMAGMGNTAVPDTHFLRHTFGFMPEDPRLEDVKSGILGAKSEPILQKLDKFYYKHHPAVQMARAKMKARYGEDLAEHSIFPGFWLHWLTVEPHERSRNWAPWLGSADNGGTDHAVYFNGVKRVLDQFGVPYDRNLLKNQDGDAWAAGPSMPARTAHAMKVLQDQFGDTAAHFAYYAYMVPALLSAHRARTGLLKAERLAEALLKAVQPAPEEPAKPTHMFRNKPVVAGEVEFLRGPRAGWRNPLLHIARGPVSDGHHVMVGDDGSFMRLPANGEGSSYRILRTPQYVDSGALVQVQKHALPHLAHTPEQHELLEGIDLAQARRGSAMKQKKGYTEKHGGTAVWLKSKAGHLGFVKSSQAMESVGNGDIADHLREYTTSQREAAFHLLSKKVFGMGDHVPVTAAFMHPLTGEHHSIQRGVIDGEHFKRNNPLHTAFLHHLNETGTLDKLALMDMVMGNGDRHPGNYLLTPGQGPGIHLIDNGLSLAPESSRPHDFMPVVPHYWSKPNRLKVGSEDPEQWMKQPLHQDARRWAMNLSSHEFMSEMESIGVPEKYRNEAHRRLIELQRRLANPNISKGHAYFAPWMSIRRNVPAHWLKDFNEPFMTPQSKPKGDDGSSFPTST